MARPAAWLGRGVVPPALGRSHPQPPDARAPPRLSATTREAAPRRGGQLEGVVSRFSAPAHPRPDGRREGIVRRLVAVADSARRGWGVPTPGSDTLPALPQAASLLSHAVVLAALLLIWGSAVVVPSPAPDTVVDLVLAPPTPEPVAPPQLPPPPAPTPPAPPDVPAPAPIAEPPPPPVPARVPAKPLARPAVKPAPAKPVPAPRAEAKPLPAPLPQVAAAPPAVAAATLVGGMAGACAPKYPRAEEAAGIGGRVLLRAEVAPDGSATQVTVVSSSGFPRLDRVAADALRKCHFRPATQGGQPVAGAATVPYAFTPGQ